MKQKYQQLRTVELVLWSASIGILAFYVFQFLSASNEISITASCILACVVIIIGHRRLRLLTITEQDLAVYLNQRYAQLEESADLLLREDQELNPLQRLQKNKTAERFELLYPTVQIPQHLGRAVAIFACSIIFSVALSSFTSTRNKTHASNRKEPGEDQIKNHISPAIKASKITIGPPAYTKIKKYSTTEFNIKVPEGSALTWEFSFTNVVHDPKMIISGRDTLALSITKNTYAFSKTFASPAFYQLSWLTEDSTRHFSDYGKIEIIEDGPPIIAIEDLDQFLELTVSDNLNVMVNVDLRDDYALHHAYIIATVSKGTGEAIKFREEKIQFDQPRKVSGKNIRANKSINLKSLDLGPGDELYFYVVAIDNKVPIPNIARTETYFISLQDTSKVENSMDLSLGVDLMPEYFRSQRQIIIDSEKLLAEKKRISKTNFNERSNALAHDQKILRLRYGEFLGEEFETNIGPQGADQEDDEAVEKKFGHSHDTDNEHNLIDDSNQSQKKDPLKEFAHAHDGTEEATFFVQSIKSKLKAAITIMWDAELYLRLYQPEKSLPYQYKALKLLKEISQDSRIYVHRTGFDPPPLKEEKRLSGDLSELKNSTSSATRVREMSYQEITAGLDVVEQLLQDDSIMFSPTAHETLLEAGRALARLELTMSGRYLETLSNLRGIMQDQVSNEDKRTLLMKIRAAFWKLLPAKTTTPQPQPRVTHEFDVQFLENISEMNSLKR